MIFAIAALLALVAAGTCFYISYNKNNKDLELKFQNKKSEVFQELQEKKSRFDSQLYQEFEQKKQELNKQLEDYNIQIQQKQEKIYQEFENLDNEYCEYKKKLDGEREILLKEHQDKIISEDRIYIEKIKEKEIFYSQKIESLKQELENFLTNIENQKIKVKEELKIYEDKQNELIKQFKEQKKKKNQEDFYRIQISSKDEEDIKKLRGIADSLNSPTVLYKLIWENYYKTQFSNMCGRVISKDEKPIGVYKITNRENGKCYIGQTRAGFQERWRSHVRKGLKAEASSRNKFYEELWEVGPENFTFEVLSYCTPEELNEKEKYYIEFFKSNEWGYNSTGGNK